jgi:hypothetical protein
MGQRVNIQIWFNVYVSSLEGCLIIIRSGSTVHTPCPRQRNLPACSNWTRQGSTPSNPTAMPEFICGINRSPLFMLQSRLLGKPLSLVTMVWLFWFACWIISLSSLLISSETGSTSTSGKVCITRITLRPMCCSQRNRIRSLVIAHWLIADRSSELEAITHIFLSYV